MNRRLFALLLLLVWPVACTPAPTVAPSPTATPPLRHEPAVPGLPPAQPRELPPFSLAAHTLFLDRQVAALAVAAGFDSVVQVFPWRDINPRPNLFVWYTADEMVKVAQEYNLALIARLDMPPFWAQRGDPTALPFELPTYLDFVGAAAERYRGYVAGYIIWNEPNLAVEWGGWVASPADYADVLCQAHARIRAADPGALVIAAGLAPTNEFSERAMDDREFLRQLLLYDVQPCFDILAAHDYGYGLSPEDLHDAHGGLNLARMLDLRAVMEQAGAAHPIWITELGYTVQPGSHPHVSLDEQATYLTGAFERVRREWPWVTLFTVWNLGYTGDDVEMQGFNILNADFTPRPAFEVIPDMRRSLDGP
ncbi:MAG: hypothetical protein JXA21_07210 [Anaerolineae bacterium]|nr:hypothetical protein [Anaerolineae bacterium]